MNCYAFSKIILTGNAFFTFAAILFKGSYRPAGSKSPLQEL
jgi:hypothetical protein